MSSAVLPVRFTKSRSGCLNCRKRKIKCDETRPVCKRCEKAKLQCSAYPHVFVSETGGGASSSSKTLPPLTSQTAKSGLLSSFKATPQEWQHFEYYSLEVPSSIGDLLNHDFWYDQVLTRAQADKTVRQAVFALGALHQHTKDCFKTYHEDCSEKSYREAISYYGKAIQGLKSVIIESGQTELALVVGVIFICIEQMLGNVRNSMNMIRQTYMLATSSRASCKQLGSSIDHLHHRLAFTALARSQDWKVWEPDQSSPSSSLHGQKLTTLEGASNALYPILNGTLLSIRRDLIAPRKAYSHDEADVVTSQHFSHQRDLHLWDETVAHLPQDIKQTESFALLRSYRLLAEFWTSASIAGLNDPLCATQIEAFREIMDIASKHVTESSASRQPPRFKFEMGWMPLLYTVAIKCRDPALRRRALKLMQYTPARESVMHRAEQMAVAKRTIELEEVEIPRGRVLWDISNQLSEQHDQRSQFEVVFWWATLDGKHIAGRTAETMTV